ncbi:MAG: hypothetical protein KAY24_10035 [Candidatus Eisenbacteria sp.]|nr:hypothetical protein [Candidatus Eisenbacteria bacterium]
MLRHGASQFQKGTIDWLWGHPLEHQYRPWMEIRGVAPLLDVERPARPIDRVHRADSIPADFVKSAPYAQVHFLGRKVIPVHRAARRAALDLALEPKSA